ncbi:hypothetical protein WJX74_004369 [Apatococcus lobatus]|uniref:Hexosyltransferase n=1 Tax=Apatococcus lobatus TaxID=904363 RepID=A0AAW1QKW8_9CHLO
MRGTERQGNLYGRSSADPSMNHSIRVPNRRKMTAGSTSRKTYLLLAIVVVIFFLAAYSWRGSAGVASTFQGRPKAAVFRQPQPKAPGVGHINLSAGPYAVERSDLVLAIPTDNLHMELVEAGRQWHKGIRTYLAVNDSSVVAAKQQEAPAFQETWELFADDQHLKALHPGDSRAALAPFLAHQAFGDTYKWMLYGDDDTMFFVEGIQNLVKDIDPNMPYLITDHLWWSSVKGTIGNHPNPEAPRCLPCNYTAPESWMDELPAFAAPRGCPCTAQLICQTDERHIFDADCHIPLHPLERTYSMHGGAGALLSIGLMRSVPLSFMQDCLANAGVTTGGDALLTICLWKAGYAHTDPGFSFYHPTVRMFDPGPEDSPGLLYAMTEALSGRCDPSCQLQLQHVITSHIRSRHQASLHSTAQMMRALSNTWDLYASQIFAPRQSTASSIN